MIYFFNFDSKFQVMKKLSVISSDPKRLGGTPVFRGTRIPIQILFDHLIGSTIEEFLHGYPSITRDMVNEVLSIAAKKLTYNRYEKELMENWRKQFE
jgi:uncharacterized protein (DUF433 family)